MYPDSREGKTGREREEEEEGGFLQPERLAEGWRLRAAARREASPSLLQISAGAERERRTERGVCASWMFSAASLTD